MGEVIYSERFLRKWEVILAEAENTREMALRKVAQFTLEASGQMVLPFDQAPEPTPTQAYPPMDYYGVLGDYRSIARDGEW